MDVAYSQDCSEINGQGRLELSPAISGDDNRAAEMVHSISDKCSGDCFLWRYLRPGSPQPECGAFRACKHADGTSGRRQRTDQVNVHVREIDVRWLRDKTNCVLRYLDALSLHAGTFPPANINIHEGPEPPGCDEVLGFSDVRVPLAVNSVKNGATKTSVGRRFGRRRLIFISEGPEVNASVTFTKVSGEGATRPVATCLVAARLQALYGNWFE